MAKLQIAVDLMTEEQAALLADEIHDVIDIFEVGTPMIVRDGLHPVRRIKEKHPELTVLADTKIVDGGSLECEDACKAGADIITVLAMADNATIQGVADSAHRYGRKAMADLIQVPDIAKRAKELVELGVDYICVHTGVDMQQLGRTPLEDLDALVSAVCREKAAVAGGISSETLESYLEKEPAIVIMGSALCSMPDVRKAVIEIQNRIGQFAGKRRERE